MDIDAKTEVNSTALAAVLGITARRIQQLTQDGIIKPLGKRKYLLAESVQNYIEYRTREKVMTKADIEKQNADISIKKAKAIVAVLEANELQGKMHRSEDVAAMTEDLIYTIRGGLMALPGRLAVDTANAKTAAEASEIIRVEVYKLMKELANYRYDPAKYEERVRERHSWEVREKCNLEPDEFSDEEP